MLKEWKEDFNLKRDMLRTLPLWVKLQKLPLHLWGAKGLSKIGSAIGVPLVTDECTANKLRVSYARILIEVDVTKEMVKEIAIKDCEGRKLMQPVEYEWKSLYCERCQCIGHKCKDYVKKQWKPKAKPPDTIASNSDQVKNVEVDHRKQEEELEIASKPEDNAWITVSSTIKDKGKIKEISSRLKSIKPNILILIETRVKATKASKIRDRLNLYDNYLDNYQNHENGRIWISWNDRNIYIKYVHSSDQYIYYGVFDLMGDFKFWLTAIYGKNHMDIIKMIPNAPDPWCLVGDYNNAASAQDRIGGRMVMESEYSDLQDMMLKAGLSEMDSCGDYFTRCNRHTLDPIHSRIDSLIGNVDWFNKYSDLTLKILPPSVSDHALLLLIDNNQIKRTSRFKFYNCITELPWYGEVVSNS
ncbi:uncharacterized protein LOC131659349 [Vicia villosa]|uniref:uncharacterized protein LOC131659349 n=1 Tax=Vicia villosa TaxID=3911 RepID=UPI00273A7A0C|nr:uncharacterized protein LOC131659349 [Vicia villosa]